MKYHGKDSADSRREEFLEVPFKEIVQMEAYTGFHFSFVGTRCYIVTLSGTFVKSVCD